MFYFYLYNSSNNFEENLHVIIFVVSVQGLRGLFSLLLFRIGHPRLVLNTKIIHAHGDYIL